MENKNKRPNIVLILTDQQRLDTIAALGYPHMETPNLDRLANEGTVFENMYVTAPSCSPSRASLFSGLYPHTNGIFRNDEPWNYCWVQELADTGYRCVNVGKMHTMPIEGPFGFHERHVVENKDRDHPNLPFYLDNWDKALKARGVDKPSRVSYRKREDYKDCLGAFVWEIDEDLHPDVFVPQTAVWWLERYNGNEPFFLEIGIPGPHPPYDPTARYLDKYIGKDLPKPIRDYDLDSHPEPLKKLRENHINDDHDAVYHLRNPTPEQTHRQRAHYYANVTMIDDQVGELMKALDKRGVLEDTIIIFTTDHGDCLNDHGLSQKWNMFEQSIHVPAIVWAPGKVAAGKKVSDLVAHFDLGPTILDLAKANKPDWMEAISLHGYLTDTEQTKRERVFAEHSDDPILEGTMYMTMVREGNYKLVHFVDHEVGQLFNLQDDPQEKVNLWNDEEHQAIKQRLLHEILTWRTLSARHTQGFHSRA